MAVPSEGQDLLEQARADLEKAASVADLERIKAAYLGRSGRLALLLRTIGSLAPAARRVAGENLNRLRRNFEELRQQRAAELRAQSMAAAMSAAALDVSLPGRGPGAGSVHPLSLVTERCVSIFSSMGFDLADGPEIEEDLFNFKALNYPDDHPARSMHDTFYLSDGRLLRTHTSPVQMRYLRSHQPPLRVVAPGRCFRVDSDATHSPMFHQIEGMWVDQQVRFSDLKGILLEFFRLFFEDPRIEVRFRPSFFPFTEPSAECDLKLAGNWLEVAGCGMMHPNVLANGGVDPAQHQGWAFGTGLDRLAMLRYGIRDIRDLFENDLRFLRQFS